MPEEKGYRHLCEIGGGGMGRVYVAIRRGDPERKLYAVKRLHPHLGDHPRARKTLTDEARLAGNVSHPNVLGVYDTGTDADGPYLAMDYVEGCSLAELTQAVRRADEEIPLQICLDIAQQVAMGLHAIHEQVGGLLVVHRDVSPQNILIDYEGQVRIADFGIAKPLNADQPETSTGVLKGKIGYMSPEQLRFERPDRRADLFALGVVTFELLTGRRLYTGSDGTEGARRILHEPPPDVGDDREDAPPEVVQLLFELLAKNPGDRPDSAGLVAERFAHIVGALKKEEGPIDLGNYTGSFFERDRKERRKMIDSALARIDDQKPESTKEVSKEPTRKKRWRVKGAAIAATIEYLQGVYGEDAYARVVELTDERVQEALSNPVLVSSWYDGSVMVDLTEKAEQLFGSDNEQSLALKIGIASATYALSEGGPYEVFRTQGLRQGIKSFLGTSYEIYRLYYDVGSWVVEDLQEHSVVIRIKEGMVFPTAITDRILGFLHGGFQQLGAENVRATGERSGNDLVLRATWSEPTYE